jgi:signal transduction histidine kinase
LVLLLDAHNYVIFYATGRRLHVFPQWTVIGAFLLVRAIVFPFRRRWPVAVACLLPLTLLPLPVGPWIDQASPQRSGWLQPANSYGGVVIFAAGVYLATARRGRWVGLGVAGVVVALSLPVFLPQAVFFGPAPLLFFLIPMIGAVIFGEVRRRVESGQRRVEERARAIEASRDVAATNAVDAERARLGAELQMLVADNLNVMVQRAADASIALKNRAVAEALHLVTDIEDTGRAALAEARNALRALRQEGSPRTPVSKVNGFGGGHSTDHRHDDLRPSAPRVVLFDLMPAAVLLVFFVTETASWTNVGLQKSLERVAHPSDALAMLGIFGALAIRRVAPLACCLVVSAAFFLHGGWGHFFGASEVYALTVAAYSAWAFGGTRRGVVGLVATWIAVVPAIHAIEDPFGLSATRYLVALLLLPVASFLGEQTRRLRAVTADLEAQTEALAKARDVEVTHARNQERLRIARELHDITAHSISVMTVQA